MLWLCKNQDKALSLTNLYSIAKSIREKEQERIQAMAEFALPPGVNGASRGVLKIECFEADGPVYLLWWGETREMKVTPKNQATIFDSYILELPIKTSDEMFF